MSVKPFFSRVDHSRDTPGLPAPHVTTSSTITSTTAAAAVNAWSGYEDEASFRPVSRGLGVTAVRASRTAPRKPDYNGDGRSVPTPVVSQESKLTISKRFAAKLPDGPCPPHSAGIATATNSSGRRTNRRSLPTSAPNYLAPIHNNGGGSGGSGRIKLRRGSGSYTGTGVSMSSTLPGVPGGTSVSGHGNSNSNNNQSGVGAVSYATTVTRTSIKPHSIALDVDNVNVSSPKGKNGNTNAGVAGPGSGPGLGLTRNTFSPVRIGALALGLSTTQALQKFIIKVPVSSASTTTSVSATMTTSTGACPPVIWPTAAATKTINQGTS